MGAKRRGGVIRAARMEREARRHVLNMMIVRGGSVNRIDTIGGCDVRDERA